MERIIHYNERLEKYLKTIGERSYGLSILHQKAEILYGSRNNWINIPVIILGTLNGAVSVGSGTLFNGSQMASVGIGCIALLGALLSTVNSYFAWGRRAEGHRIASLSYGKLFRFLDVELALPRRERMTASDLLKYVKSEFDRLNEISPVVPVVVVDEAKKLFATYTDIALPTELNGLERIEVCVELPELPPAHRTETYA